MTLKMIGHIHVRFPYVSRERERKEEGRQDEVTQDGIHGEGRRK